MNTYEEKKQARIERYQDRADKAASRATSAYQRSNDLISGIPMGQPVLVGHHSEKRHRRALDRSWNLLGKSCEEQKKAEYWQRRAEAAEQSRDISSDDPEAIQKLKERIKDCEVLREGMKKLNAEFRKAKGDWSKIDCAEKTKEAGRRLMASCPWEKKPVPSYSLTNLGANIRRLKARVVELEARLGEETTETQIGEVKIVENVEENRCQAFFPGKPCDEVRTFLKKNGFRWSRYNGCWQRHKSYMASLLAKDAAELFNRLG